MATTNINVRVDEDLKKDVDSLLNDLGLTLSTAINIYLRQMVQTQSIPFTIKRYNEETEKAIHDAHMGIGLSEPFDSIEKLREALDAED